MPNRGPYLPEIWGDSLIHALPYEMADEVERQMLSPVYADCRYIKILDYPEQGQSWSESLLTALCLQYSGDLFVSSVFTELQKPNTSSLTPPMKRIIALKRVLGYLSNNKRLLLHLRHPIRDIQECDFEHLAQYIDSNIGIVCHLINPGAIARSIDTHICYCEMKKIINEGNPVYFSYSRVSSTKLVKVICASLDAKDIEYSLDMIDLDAQSSIKEYERAIGNGGFVIVILSDEYFKSPDCMYEMSALVRRGDIRERVLFVADLGAVKRNKKSHDIIFKQWKKKYQDYKDIDPTDVSMTQERGYIEQIIQCFPEFWIHVKDDIALLATDVEKDSAESLSNIVLKKVTPLPKPDLSPLPADLVNTGNTPSTVVVNQTGTKSVYIGTNNGTIEIS